MVDQSLLAHYYKADIFIKDSFRLHYMQKNYYNILRRSCLHSNEMFEICILSKGDTFHRPVIGGIASVTTVANDIT